METPTWKEIINIFRAKTTRILYKPYPSELERICDLCDTNHSAFISDGTYDLCLTCVAELSKRMGFSQIADIEVPPNKEFKDVLRNPESIFVNCNNERFFGAKCDSCNNEKVPFVSDSAADKDVCIFCASNIVRFLRGNERKLNASASAMRREKLYSARSPLTKAAESVKRCRVRKEEREKFERERIEMEEEAKELARREERKRKRLNLVDYVRSFFKDLLPDTESMIETCTQCNKEKRPFLESRSQKLAVCFDCIGDILKQIGSPPGRSYIERHASFHLENPDLHVRALK